MEKAAREIKIGIDKTLAEERARIERKVMEEQVAEPQSIKQEISEWFPERIP